MAKVLLSQSFSYSLIFEGGQVGHFPLGHLQVMLANFVGGR
jgi:hypothetical protein